MKTPSLPANTILDHTAMCGMLYRSYALALSDCEVYRTGYFWYNVANDDCHRAVQSILESDIEVDFEAFCKHVSSVSPSRVWRSNVVDAIHGVFAWNSSQSDYNRIAYLADCSVAVPYGYDGFRRGWAILSGNRELSFKSGPKTFSFADNIIFPDTSLEVTVDQHIVHLMLNDGKFNSIKISLKQYKAFKKAIIDVAQQIGLLPSRLQAICWHQRQSELSSR